MTYQILIILLALLASGASAHASENAAFAQAVQNLRLAGILQSAKDKPIKRLDTNEARGYHGKNIRVMFSKTYKTYTADDNVVGAKIVYPRGLASRLYAELEAAYIRQQAEKWQEFNKGVAKLLEAHIHAEHGQQADSQ